MELTQEQVGQQPTVKLAKAVNPEVKFAAAQAVLSSGEIEISEILRDRREETLALVQRLLASAGIVGTFSLPKADEPNIVAIELDQNAEPAKELSPEQKWLGEFKERFSALSELHKGVRWEDVVAKLKSNPNAKETLMRLDKAGFEMTVFGEKNGKIVFRTAQADVTQIDPAYRTIMYDKQAQDDYPQFNARGNAVDLAAKLGCELADKDLYEECRVKNGWMYLKTDDATRKSGDACYGYESGAGTNLADYHSDRGSLCAALRV